MVLRRYAAVAFASRSPVNFRSAVIIHASALAQQMGTRVFPILWTTGTKDPLYGPGPTSVRFAARSSQTRQSNDASELTIASNDRASRLFGQPMLLPSALRCFCLS